MLVSGYINACYLLPLYVLFWDSDMPVQDPYLRCTWDNMVMLSPIVKQSLRPVFNQSFYFPVRAAQLQDSAYSRPAYDMFLSAATPFFGRLCKTFEVVFPEMRMGSKVLIQLHTAFYVFSKLGLIRSVDFSLCTATLIDLFARDRQKKSTKTAYLSMS